MKKKILLIAIFVCLLQGCVKYKPIIDTAGRSGTFDTDQAKEITNDQMHCEKLAKDNTNFISNITFWALNQNLYSPLVLDAKGNRVGDTMTVLTPTKQTNPSSQYLTQRYQIPVPLPRYDAFEPNAETKPTLNDRFQDWSSKFTQKPLSPIFIAVAIVTGIILIASGKKVI